MGGYLSVAPRLYALFSQVIFAAGKFELQDSGETIMISGVLFVNWAEL